MLHPLWELLGGESCPHITGGGRFHSRPARFGYGCGIITAGVADVLCRRGAAGVAVIVVVVAAAAGVVAAGAVVVATAGRVVAAVATGGQSGTGGLLLLLQLHAERRYIQRRYKLYGRLLLIHF